MERKISTSKYFEFTSSLRDLCLAPLRNWIVDFSKTKWKIEHSRFENQSHQKLSYSSTISTRSERKSEGSILKRRHYNLAFSMNLMNFLVWFKILFRPGILYCAYEISERGGWHITSLCRLVWKEFGTVTLCVEHSKSNLKYKKVILEWLSLLCWQYGDPWCSSGIKCFFR